MIEDKSFVREVIEDAVRGLFYAVLLLLLFGLVPFASMLVGNGYILSTDPLAFLTHFDLLGVDEELMGRVIFAGLVMQMAGLALLCTGAYCVWMVFDWTRRWVSRRAERIEKKG